VRRIKWSSLAGRVMLAAPSGGAGFVSSDRSNFDFLASSLPYMTQS
jgi:hypothetical protein